MLTDVSTFVCVATQYPRLGTGILTCFPFDRRAKSPIKALTTIGVKKLQSRPSQVLERFPPEVLAKLEIEILLRLPPETIAKLPGDVINQLPRETLQTLPPTGIRKLDPGNLAMLPATVFEQIPVGDLPIQANSIGMKFKLLPPGRSEKIPQSGTLHPNGDLDPKTWKEAVAVNYAFEIGVFEVTQQEFQQVMGFDPFTTSIYRHRAGVFGPQKAMSFHSTKDIKEFCKRLNALPIEKAAGYTYRPTTFAEWHYACRAGATSVYPWGNDASMLRRYVYLIDFNTGSPDVGSLQPNKWGLYDMLGNFPEIVTHTPRTLPYGKDEMNVAGEMRGVSSNPKSFKSYSQADYWNGSIGAIVDKKTVVMHPKGGAALRLVRVKRQIPRDSVP